MKYLRYLVPLFFLSTASAETLAPFKKLSGCWENRSSDQIYEEQWMKPAGDMMLGMSRTLKNGKVVTFEFIQLQTRADVTFYLASPYDTREMPGR